MQEGMENTQTIEEAVRIRKSQIHNGILTPKDYDTVVDFPDVNVIRKYGDRAIVREVDQILSIVRSNHSGESSFELLLNGTKSSKFTFNRETAKKFHTLVASRTIGEPIIYTAEVISLDKNNLNGKIKNLSSKKTANIMFSNEAALKKVISHFENGSEMKFVGCPFIEYDAFDPMAGDIYFIELK